MLLAVALLSFVAAAPASQPAAKPASQPVIADDDTPDPDDDPEEAVDDEAAELWKLQELDVAGAALLDDDDWLPVSDIDAAQRQTLRLYRTHPEEVAALLESDPAALLGRRLSLPAVESLWPMFVEYDGKTGLYDPAAYDIPLQMHPMVEQWMAFFTGRGREYFTRWLSRSTRYIPIFRAILKEHGMPQDTVYLSMIESGFNVRAFSRAKAAGPWQFMKGTGVRFGLKVDSWVDDRRDWIKATHAAAKYLKELHGQLGHWYLAWAGYNAGGGRISRAIHKFETRDFFEMIKPRGLHPETKNYVPKLIAAAIIAKSPRRFGFTDVEWLQPFDFETVSVEGGVDLRYAAQACGIDRDTMLEMNPSLKFGITPPDRPKWELRVPKGTKDTFAAKLAALLPKTKPQYRIHEARRGETLAGIAAIYGSLPEVIREQNKLGPDNRLPRGIDLLVPLVPGVKPQPRPPEPVRVATPKPAGAPLVAKDGQYVVQQGDSLWSISQAHGCTIADLKRLNGITNHRGLQAGQAIKLP